MRACSLVGSLARFRVQALGKPSSQEPPHIQFHIHTHPDLNIAAWADIVKVETNTLYLQFSLAPVPRESTVLQWLDRPAALSRPYQISISLAIASSTDRRHNLQFQCRYLMRIFEYFPEYLNIFSSEYLNFSRIFEYVSRIF